MTLQKTDTSIRKRKKVHLFIYIARGNWRRRETKKEEMGKKKERRMRDGKDWRERKGLRRDGKE